MCGFSDAALSTLEAIEPPCFDASKLHGVTPSLLHDLTKLTFISDEKIGTNPLFPRPKKSFSDPQGHFRDRSKSDGNKSDSQKLEEKLDADIAKALGDDTSGQDVIDHNADKKPQLAANLESALRHLSTSDDDDDEDGSLSELNESMSSLMSSFAGGQQSLMASAEVAELQQQIRHQLARLCVDLDADTGSVQSLTSQMLSRVSETLQEGSTGRDSGAVADSVGGPEASEPAVGAEAKPDRERKDRVKKDEGDTEGKSDNDLKVPRDSSVPLSKSSGDLTTSPSKSKPPTKELDMLRIASLQLGALKALSVLMGCNKFVELLLVPKVDHKEEKKSSVEGDTGTAPSDEDLRDAVRGIMKQMVKRAVMPSPIKRSLALGELERAQSVLHRSAVNHHSEEELGVKAKKGDKLSEDLKLLMFLHLCSDGFDLIASQ